MNARCDACRHWRESVPLKTKLERWEEDTRPERPKGFIGAMRWMWDPNQFREPHPYDDDGWNRSMDEARKVDNANLGHCYRYPEPLVKNRGSNCGEFKPAIIGPPVVS